MDNEQQNPPSGVLGFIRKIGERIQRDPEGFSPDFLDSFASFAKGYLGADKGRVVSRGLQDIGGGFKVAGGARIEGAEDPITKGLASTIHDFSVRRRDFEVRKGRAEEKQNDRDFDMKKLDKTIAASKSRADEANKNREAIAKNKSEQPQVFTDELGNSRAHKVIDGQVIEVPIQRLQSAEEIPVIEQQNPGAVAATVSAIANAPVAIAVSTIEKMLPGKTPQEREDIVATMVANSRDLPQQVLDMFNEKIAPIFDPDFVRSTITQDAPTSSELEDFKRNSKRTQFLKRQGL